MSLKLNLAPDQAGYATRDGDGVLSTMLDGGASRYRQDVVNAHALINVQWRVNPEEFRYLRSFYNLLTAKGAKVFLIDLYLDSENLTEHECHFVPGSFRLTGQRGMQFSISAQLEAKPVKLTAAEEEAERLWTTLYGELGAEYLTLFPPIESDFDQIITFDLPRAFGGPPVEPLGGWLRTINPNTATMGNLYDVIATLIYDNGWGNMGTWTVTEPSGGWLRVFDPNTTTVGQLFDVVATLAHDMPTTAEVYTLLPATPPLYVFDPNTATHAKATDVLGTLLIELQSGGVIG